MGVEETVTRTDAETVHSVVDGRAGRVALVTGCSSGIGRELALRLHEGGYRVFATARRPETLEGLTGKGIGTLELDVTDGASVDAVVASVRAAAGRIDLLINNAGYGAMGPVAEMPLAEVVRQFDTNVYGVVRLVQACAPLMRGQGGGVIVNIGSCSGILPTPFSGVYCASKAALHALDEVLRMELAPFGIQVMSVQPGAIESSFGDNAEASLARTLPPESMYAALREQILRRARASQSHPTSTAQFVTTLIAYLDRERLPPVVRIGKGHLGMPLLRLLLPARVREWLLGRVFGLRRARGAET